MSYKPSVKVNGKWETNNLTFATEVEAETSARDLMSRWMLVEDCKAIESDQEVNYQIVDGVMSAVTQREKQK